MQVDRKDPRLEFQRVCGLRRDWLVGRPSPRVARSLANSGFVCQSSSRQLGNGRWAKQRLNRCSTSGRMIDPRGPYVCFAILCKAKGGTPYLYAPGKPKQRVQLPLGRSSGVWFTQEEDAFQTSGESSAHSSAGQAVLTSGDGLRRSKNLMCECQPNVFSQKMLLFRSERVLTSPQEQHVCRSTSCP